MIKYVLYKRDENKPKSIFEAEYYVRITDGLDDVKLRYLDGAWVPLRKYSSEEQIMAGNNRVDKLQILMLSGDSSMIQQLNELVEAMREADKTKRKLTWIMGIYAIAFTILMWVLPEQGLTGTQIVVLIVGAILWLGSAVGLVWRLISAFGTDWKDKA